MDSDHTPTHTPRGVWVGEPFGVRLRRIRERAGLTQERLAELAGLSANAISSLERGARRHPYPHTRDALYRALGVTADERRDLEAGLEPRGQLTSLPRLPVAPWPVLGRDTEIDTIAGLLPNQVQDQRLVTLIGPGGVGKTRLALAVAERVAGQEREGAVFVPLSPIREPTDVLPTIAAHLGLRELGSRDVREVLVAHLRGRQLLLVLDNFEHVIGASTALADLLATAPAVTALVTSRAPLRIRGEQVYPVPVLPAAAAAELFTTRARQATGPAAHARVPEVIAAICAKLDHLPLAIELAAARTRLLTPDQLLDRLDHLLSTVVGGPRDAPERHQTLRQTVAWSYQLLDPPARQLLRHLSVFAGGWTLPAAAALTGLAEGTVLDLHQALLDNSLIVADGTRFLLLDTIRAFAAEQLDQAGQAEAALDRHAGYFAELAAGAALWGTGQVARLDHLAAEQDNLRAALRRLADRRRTDELADAAFGLWLLWVVRGQFADPLSWVDNASDVPPATQARLQFVAGWMLLPRGRYAQAVDHFAEAARLARAADDPVVLAWTLPSWAHAEVYRGQPGLAVPLLAEATDLADQLPGDTGPHVHSCVVIGQAHVLIATGQLNAADEMLTQQLPFIEARGAEWPLAVALGIQGRLAALHDDHQRADQLLTRSVRIFHQLRDTWGMSHQLTHVADAAALRGDHRRAALLYGAIDAIAEQTGARIFPLWQDLSDRCQHLSLTTLGIDTYRDLRQQGRRLTPTEVDTLATQPAPQRT
jgi:predicted ATPase/DNA-binding XRE family transcriptional regulator